MIKVSVFYPNSADAKFDMAYYTTKHMPMVKRLVAGCRSIAADEAQAYWETGEPSDKAGAYAIQGRAAIFVADLRGSYSGVMGLPLFETAELLSDAGVWHWPPTGQTS